MVDLFKQEDLVDKHFKEGKYATKIETTKTVDADPEEVVHIPEDDPAETEAEIQKEDTKEDIKE